MARGDVIRHVTAGGGGYGDPYVRDPDAVLADVESGKVTVEHARNAYGVVVDPVAHVVDTAATAALRARR